jgi:putative ABC transport system permease protein
MNFLESAKIAVRALRVNKMRSILTILGIIVGVASVVCMLAVGAGAQAEIAEKIRTLGADLLLAVPGAQTAGGARLEAGTQPTLTEHDASAIRRDLADVQIAAPLISHHAQIVAGNKNWATLVAGVNTDYLTARDWRILRGRTFTATELASGEKVAIIGSDVAEHLFEGRSGLGETLRITSVPFTVIATLDKKGQGAAGRSQDDVVFIPLSTAKSRILGAARGGAREALDFIAIKVADPQAMPKVRQGVEALLRRRHQLRENAPDDFSLNNPADVLTARQNAVRVLAILLTSVASISLLVGGISIMNIMLVSTSERTREIGLRRAVGARSRDIRRQFLMEAVILALTGGLAGVVLGILTAIAIAWQASWPVLVSPPTILLAFTLAALVGIFFGLYPAYRASRLDPIEALRFE